jgi:hypothetical protein
LKTFISAAPIKIESPEGPQDPTTLLARSPIQFQASAFYELFVYAAKWFDLNPDSGA